MARILYAEDLEHYRKGIAEQLERKGHSVTQCDRCQGALEKIECGQPYDLLLTDIDMPDGISGIELARRASAANPSMPIVVLSASASMEDMSKEFPTAYCLNKAEFRRLPAIIDAALARASRTLPAHARQAKDQDSQRV